MRERQRDGGALWIALCLLLQMLAPGAWAVVVDSAYVPRVEVTGDSSLDPQVITQIAGLNREPALSAETIRKRLLDTNLFATVQVSRDDRKVKVYLQQKVTWFVIPYASGDPSGTYYSLTAGKAIIAHEDVFGYARYQAGTSDHEGNFGLQGRNILGSPWDAGMGYSFQNALKWTYTGRDITQRTDDEYNGGDLEIAYRLGLPWKLSFTNYVEDHRFQTPDGRLRSGLQWSHKLTFGYDDYYSIEGLGEGYRASLYFEATDPLSTFRFSKTGAEGTVSLFHNGDFDWVLFPRAEIGWQLPFYQRFELGGQSLRGFPSEQFRDQYDVALLNNIYLYSWNIWAFQPRLLTFTDWAFIQSEGRFAAGAGVQVGVRDLLVSAIQVLAGYGLNPDGFTLTVSLGQKVW